MAARRHHVTEPGLRHDIAQCGNQIAFNHIRKAAQQHGTLRDFLPRRTMAGNVTKQISGQNLLYSLIS